MDRWQSSEGRAAAVWFSDSSGSPVTGLTPTATAYRKSDGTGVTAPTVAAVGSGFYRVSFASSPTFDVLVIVDGGAGLSTGRYVPLEIPVGGYVDSVDATVTSRASQPSVTALGSPAQTSDSRFAHLDADVSSRASQASITSLGSPAQASAVQSATDDLQASLSTILTRVDVATSTRAAEADLTAALADLDTILTRLTSVRAGLLDNLDAAISSRATPDDVSVTVAPGPEGQVK